MSTRAWNPSALLIPWKDRDAERWAIAWWTSRRFCFRAKAIESMPPLLLRGSPSPPWFTFSYSTESAGRRCSSRLSAPLGRCAGFSHRLIVARFSGFLHMYTDFFYRGICPLRPDKIYRLLSYAVNIYFISHKVSLIRLQWYRGEGECNSVFM